MAVPLLHFHLNELFKNVFCILAEFSLAAVLATFEKIGRFFSKLSGQPVHNLFFSSSSMLMGLIKLECCSSRVDLIKLCWGRFIHTFVS